ncbi:biotin--[acetyl-CoA-carboxylase] ligase [Roseateles koreensis]|uniref:biotin--[biotin carboxyl-carrier protein] ligase n=1 Tax=Roseateles koreensis TaxID=2987526 RepID=A0ABT5KWB0_9BURK|nr:biotin--[acetyl-CoA-carboxylase] ligase [Roseateles koreensis]MDC8787228.1 biotin--[acetyl-CoA-carboxylase] ligase [Roseateles koreensis]
MPGTEKAHQDWRAEALWESLTPLLPGISVEILARCESTNSALLERVRSEATSGHPLPYGRRSHDMLPCLLVAEHQTHGRGRMGRAWLSGTSGRSLTFSLALPMAVADWSGLSLVLGCAIAEALEPEATAPRLMLKWPNDIWLDERKLGGILIETVPAGNTRMVIIGVGLNISEPSGGEELSPSQYNTGFAALSELPPLGAGGWTGPDVLALIAPAMARALLDFQARGFAPWRADYARRDLTLGRHVSAGALSGVSRGISASGELMIETPDQGLQAVNGGEVSLRLTHDPA